MPERVKSSQLCLLEVVASEIKVMAQEPQATFEEIFSCSYIDCSSTAVLSNFHAADASLNYSEDPYDK